MPVGSDIALAHTAELAAEHPVFSDKAIRRGPGWSLVIKLSDNVPGFHAKVKYAKIAISARMIAIVTDQGTSLDPLIGFSGTGSSQSSATTLLDKVRVDERHVVRGNTLMQREHRISLFLRVHEFTASPSVQPEQLVQRYLVVGINDCL